MQRSAESLSERWLAAFERSPLRLPGRLDDQARAVWRQTLSAVAEAFCELGPALAEVAPGSGWTRELEKRLAFLGGALAGLGANPFDVSALILALRDSAELPPRASRLFDWFLATCHAGFAASLAEAQALEFREVLERSTPVVVVPGASTDIPALLLVGAPDRGVLDGLLGRLLLAVVRTGARTAIIDATGAIEPGSEPYLAALGRLAAHPYASSRPLQIVCAGLPEAIRGSWGEALRLTAPGSQSRLTVSFCEGFQEAVGVASA